MRKLITLFLILFSSVVYGANHFYDVREFAIEGVKLGMTYEEAKVAALKNMELNESDITLPGENEHKITGEIFHSEFILQTRKHGRVHTELRVLMIENVSKNQETDRSVVVNEIRFNRPIDIVNSALARRYVKEHYDSPAIVRNGKHLNLEWCNKIDIDPNYERCHPDAANLSLLETLLVLNNPKYLISLQEYVSNKANK